MPHITLDTSKCQGHGRCVMIAPAYFDVDDDGLGMVLVDEMAEADSEHILEAISACPENAIGLQS